MKADPQSGATCVHFLEAARQYRCENACLACSKSRMMTYEHIDSNGRRLWDDLSYRCLSRSPVFLSLSSR